MKRSKHRNPGHSLGVEKLCWSSCHSGVRRGWTEEGNSHQLLCLLIPEATRVSAIHMYEVGSQSTNPQHLSANQLTTGQPLRHSDPNSPSQFLFWQQSKNELRSICRGLVWPVLQAKHPANADRSYTALRVRCEWVPIYMRGEYGFLFP